jgi:putative transposase
MEKYQGKYRIPSARWAAWDYASNAAYFITICTARREHYFGAVANGTMTLTPVGQAAMDCWNEIPAHFPFVVLDEFVVMPNHVHGILVIDKPIVETQNVASGVQTQDIASLPNRFGPQSQNLASIVRGYKIGVTKYARQNDIPFAWQDRYHDHVIRNEGEYNRIRQYVCENPQRWTDDTYYASEK